jgi:hypothetical protein
MTGAFETGDAAVGMLTEICCKAILQNTLLTSLYLNFFEKKKGCQFSRLFRSEFLTHIAALS